MGGNRSHAQYGNWVSIPLIVKVSVASLVCCASAILLSLFPLGAVGSVLRSVSFLMAALCLAAVGYFLTARRMFADDGGGIQEKILELLISFVEWDGKGRALDIGCGSGALTVKLAKRYREALITGIDYWGANWGYSRQLCQDNALAEGVSENTSFQRASASELPFPDETFDLVVSNLTFHEVKGGQGKPALVGEALRVLKKGGAFVLQDLFLISRYYGRIDDLVGTLREAGVQQVSFIDTSKSSFIPRALRLPFMVGTMGIIYGVK